jgi:hypothetical protein
MTGPTEIRSFRDYMHSAPTSPARAPPTQLNTSANATQLNSKPARAKRARRASKQINTSALRRQRLFLFQRNLSGSDSSLKCVHVRNVYTLTHHSFNPCFLRPVLYRSSANWQSKVGFVARKKGAATRTVSSGRRTTGSAHPAD